uniref:Uncharacterized protein n=1 Tax=Cacopsylla melanoneura TaxID=428564 RepID=A0A8D9BTJ4_9HEMI
MEEIERNVPSSRTHPMQTTIQHAEMRNPEKTRIITQGSKRTSQSKPEEMDSINIELTDHENKYPLGSVIFNCYTDQQRHILTTPVILTKPFRKKPSTEKKAKHTEGKETIVKTKQRIQDEENKDYNDLALNLMDLKIDERSKYIFIDYAKCRENTLVM